MDVTLVGTGPAADAVAAALDDADAEVAREENSVEVLAEARLGVVVGRTGSDRFDRANEVASDAGVPWLAVETCGVGGHAVGADGRAEGGDAGVVASVAGFAPETGCYDCLRTRVAANEAVPQAGRADGERAGEGGTAGSSEAEGAIDPADARVAGAIAGRAATRLLAGESPGLLGGVVELPYAERSFLPVPGCGPCGLERDYGLELTDGDRDLPTALAAAERALDERVGLVQEVGEAESFPAPYYLARVADTTGFSDAAAAGQAAGVDADWNAAFVKALGEALERYCAGVYRDRFRRAPPDAVGDAVDPAAFVGVAGTDEAVPWVPGLELGAASTPAEQAGTWLPAEFVQFPPPERRFGAPITTGLGLGNSTVGAVLSGLYEVLERDATMLAWYSTFEPLGLSVEDEGFAALVQRARGVGLSVTPLLVTQDVDVPVVAAAVHRDGEWPRFAVGSDADLDPAAAARSALAAALQNWMELRSMGPEAAAEESGAIGKYADFPRAAREFVDADGAVPAGSVGPDDPPAGRAELDAVVERTRAAGLRPYAARLTTPDVASLGFEAVRTVVPAAQPLFTGDPAFGERAREVPAELGFEPDLERAFHPYP
jgi:ribosomal protein S12 methylthiotransferase accessory factor